MKPISIAKSNYEKEVTNSDKPVLLDFWAPWCGPCEAIAPSLEEIAAEMPTIKVGKVNIDEEPELAAAFGVMSIPLLAVVKNGAVAGQSRGAIPKEKIIELIGRC